jgi:hypothetical protein
MLRSLWLLTAAPLLAFSQQPAALSARDLFYTEGGGSQEPSRLATRTTVQIDTASRDCGSGSTQERIWRNMPESRVFHSGERFRIVLQANVTGYLYVFAEQSSGGFADLLPREDEEVAQVKAHEDNALPAFCIRGAAGENTLWFLVTTDPQRARDFRLSLRRKPAGESGEQRITTALRQSGEDLASRDIVVETETEGEAKVSNAVYRKSAGAGGKEQLFRIIIRQE